LTEKYVTQEASLQQTEDSLNLKQQKLEQLESSLDLLKLQSESALKERIMENEGLLKKIAERENELADRMARVEELEGLIARQKQAMRNLKERLSDALLNFEDKGLTVEARDGKVYVSMENKLLFKSGSWTVEAAGQNAIKSLAGVLAENPDIAILIEGHTDNVPYRGKGPLKGNWDLSTKRATAIVNQLLENPDILPQNLTAAGRGEYLPIAPNSTRSGRAANRRIEVVLSPQLDEISQIINTLD
jgi:chemotaxis protein MotB